MKKLSKTQIEIEELAKRVPKITESQLEWAKRTFQYRIIILGNRQRECKCPSCKGEVRFPASQRGQIIRCPHCGATIKADRAFDSRGLRWTRGGVNYGNYGNHQESFFQVMSVVGGWQVTRLVYMDRYIYLRKDNSPWSFYEVCQAWNNPKTDKTYFRSFPKNCMGWHYNCYSVRGWVYDGLTEDGEYKFVESERELEPRKPNGANFFDITRLAPYAKILPAYKRFGLTADAFLKIKNYGAMCLMTGFTHGKFGTMHETLLKRGAYDVFDRITERHSYLHERDNNINAIFTAWKICQRNGYNYKRNATEWFDLVNLLAGLGLDYHSPHYVCPKDLHDMHQRVLRLHERREEERVLREKEEENKEYTERIAKYLDLDIHNDELTIKVLPDIPSFKREGDGLGHCVYRCSYYNKVDSLILSARGKHNKRWETIEVSLKTFSILQCYGYKDKHTEKHQEIIDLVMANMWQIKERKLGKKTRKVA